jgi:ribosomal protein S18
MNKEIKRLLNSKSFFKCKNIERRISDSRIGNFDSGLKPLISALLIPLFDYSAEDSIFVDRKSRLSIDDRDNEFKYYLSMKFRGAMNQKYHLTIEVASKLGSFGYALLKSNIPDMVKIQFLEVSIMVLTVSDDEWNDFTILDSESSFGFMKKLDFINTHQRGNYAIPEKIVNEIDFKDLCMVNEFIKDLKKFLESRKNEC